MKELHDRIGTPIAPKPRHDDPVNIMPSASFSGSMGLQDIDALAESLNSLAFNPLKQ